MSDLNFSQPDVTVTAFPNDAVVNDRKTSSAASFPMSVDVSLIIFCFEWNLNMYESMLVLMGMAAVSPHVAVVQN